LLWSGFASACELADPASLPWRTGLSIAISRNQRVVVYERLGAHAGQALVVLKSPYGTVEPALREVSKRQFGEALFAQKTTSAVEEWQQEFGEFGSDERDQRMRRLEAAHVKLEKFREAVIRSGRYNVRRWGLGHSELTLRIIDGGDMSLTSSTVIILRRRDESFGWGPLAHSVPIPVYGRQRASLVTDQELGVIAEVARITGTKWACFPLSYSEGLLVNSDLILQAAQWLRNTSGSEILRERHSREGKFGYDNPDSG
jgi:hypothetical protein